MNIQNDIGAYLMIWLISSAVIWLIDIGGNDVSVKTKIVAPIVLTVFVVLMRISIFLMTGE